MKIYLSTFALLTMLFTGCSSSDGGASGGGQIIGVWEQSRVIGPNGQSYNADKEEFKKTSQTGEYSFMHLEISEKILRVHTLESDSNGAIVSSAFSTLYTYENSIIKTPDEENLTLSDYKVESVTSNQMTLSLIGEGDPIKIVFTKIDKTKMENNIKELATKKTPDVDFNTPETNEPEENITSNGPVEIAPYVKDGNTKFSLSSSTSPLSFSSTITVWGKTLTSGKDLSTLAWAFYNKDLSEQLTNWQVLKNGAPLGLTGTHAEILELKDTTEIDVVKNNLSNTKIVFSVNEDVSAPKVTHYIDIEKLCDEHSSSFLNLDNLKTGCENL